MLRVGLTGDLGSGKSTVAAMFAALGAVVLSSDEMARTMMQPGQAVYSRIVERFGLSVLTPDGLLDRSELARLAFQEGRVEELNGIIHPAVLHEQERFLEELAAREPHAIAVVESALIFTTKHGVSQQTCSQQTWRERFDRIVLVTAPRDAKVARFVTRLSAGRSLSTDERSGLEQDALARLALQTCLNEAHAAECLVIENDGTLDTLRTQVEAVWSVLQQAEAATG